MSPRVAVVGAGIIGLATAWALERRGFSCLLFEQGAPGGGQSGSDSRIFRHAHDDPRQSELAKRAREGWAEWEGEFGSRLISADGALVIGEHGVERLKRYSRTTGAEVHPLGPEELAKALPVLAHFDGPAMIDPAAGAIHSRLVLACLISAAGPNLVPETVDSVTSRKGGGVNVSTSSGTREFDAVVVATGAAIAGLANTAGLEIPIDNRVQVRLTAPLREPNADAPLACLQDSSRVFGRAAAFGSPVRGNREYAVGLYATAAVDPDEGGAAQIERLTSRTREYIAKAMPGLDPSSVKPFQRWITEVPWSPEGLAIWQSDNTYFVAGRSLFKYAPELGRVLAESVSTGRVPEGFRPEDRLGDPSVGAAEGPLPG